MHTRRAAARLSQMRQRRNFGVEVFMQAAMEVSNVLQQYWEDVPPLPFFVPCTTPTATFFFAFQFPCQFSMWRLKYAPFLLPLEVAAWTGFSAVYASARAVLFRKETLPLGQGSVAVARWQKRHDKDAADVVGGEEFLLPFEHPQVKRMEGIVKHVHSSMCQAVQDGRVDRMDENMQRVIRRVTDLPYESIEVVLSRAAPQTRFSPDVGRVLRHGDTVQLLFDATAMQTMEDGEAAVIAAQQLARIGTSDLSQSSAKVDIAMFATARAICSILPLWVAAYPLMRMRQPMLRFLSSRRSLAIGGALAALSGVPIDDMFQFQRGTTLRALL
ncbi:MAG: hypothetical protein MHM6MM_001898 [Cercozoa sp. M6MM]